MITKGLIIDEPWIGYILDGTKTWEMRSTGASHRGPFALIRKGSDTVVGTADLVGVGAPLSQDEMIATQERHRIPERMIRSGEVAKWCVPWHLSGVRSLHRPVPYRHPSGAVTWVTLGSDVGEAIARQLDERPANAAPLGDGTNDRPSAARSANATTPKRFRTDDPPPAATPKRFRLPDQTADEIASGSSDATLVAQVRLTGGNIRNHHFYLRGHLHRFPGDTIGGSNTARAALRTVLVDWGGPEPVETDLDSDKHFFRRRSWIRRFFERTGAAEGDSVLVEETGPYRYRVRLVKNGSTP